MQYTTNIILIPYELKYQFKLCNYIQFTEDFKHAFNYQKSVEITTSNNNKKGFWFNRKFYQLAKINSLVELIPKYKFNKMDQLINL